MMASREKMVENQLFELLKKRRLNLNITIRTQVFKEWKDARQINKKGIYCRHAANGSRVDILPS